MLEDDQFIIFFLFQSKKKKRKHRASRDGEAEDHGISANESLGNVARQSSHTHTSIPRMKEAKKKKKRNHSHMGSHPESGQLFLLIDTRTNFVLLLILDSPPLFAAILFIRPPICSWIRPPELCFRFIMPRSTLL